LIISNFIVPILVFNHYAIQKKSPKAENLSQFFHISVILCQVFLFILELM